MQFIRSTVGNGAQGYVTKDYAAVSIIEALERVNTGGSFFSTDVLELLIEECFKFYQNSDSEYARVLLEKSLSKQEINILLLHAQKYTSEEISKKLNIKKSTIRTYTSRIREKISLNPKETLKLRLEYLKGKIIE